MCGIAGFLNNEISSDQINSNISSMLNGIHHRGPDRNDFWIEQKSKLVIANTRLAIQDLSETGSQPMISPTGRFTISFNGERIQLLASILSYYLCLWSASIISY